MFATNDDGRVVDVPLRVLRDGGGTVAMVEITDRAEYRPSLLDLRAKPGLQASALAVVLRACTAQLSRQALAQFESVRAEDLTLMQLAFAHQPSDSGILGDVFELGVLRAIQSSEPVMLGLLADALLWIGEPGEITGAFTAAAEAGGAKASAAAMEDTEILRTGKRGKPPRLKGILEKANTRDWRNDILLMTSKGGVTVSLKSHPRDIGPHLVQCQNLRYPPRLAMVPGRMSSQGVHRDPFTGTPIVTVPTSEGVLSMVKAALTTVQAAFARHLKPVGSPLGDPHGVTVQLYAWRDRTVRNILDILDEVADSYGHSPFVLSQPVPALTTDEQSLSGQGPTLGVVIAANVLQLGVPDPVRLIRGHGPMFGVRGGVNSFSVDFPR